MGVAAALLLLLAAAGGPTRTFSDICREPQSDDVAGRLIVLAPGRSGWTLGYSATEGALDEPTSAKVVRYDPASGRLSFEVKTWEVIRFRGRIAGSVLSGAMTHDGGRPKRIRLAESAGAAGPYPRCR